MDQWTPELRKAFNEYEERSSWRQQSADGKALRESGQHYGNAFLLHYDGSKDFSLADAILNGTEPLVTGYPRPTAPWTNDERRKKHPDIPKNIPVSWFDTAHAFKNGFGNIDHRAAKLSHQSRYTLCQVCGEKLGRRKIYGRNSGDTFSASGPGLHARCALLAFKFCPHLRESMDDSPDGTVFDIVEGTSSHGIYVEQVQLEYDFSNNPIYPDVGDLGLRREVTRPIHFDEIKAMAKRETKAIRRKKTKALKERTSKSPTVKQAA